MIFRIGFAVYAMVLGATAQLSPLGHAPDWSRLDAYQETITKERFEALLNDVYSIGTAYKLSLQIQDNQALIRTGETGAKAFYGLRFAPSETTAKPIKNRYWRPASALTKRPPVGKPLQGLKVAIDPGHIGGEWAQMEERWFAIDQAEPVKEGEMTLRVAKILAPRLEALGAKVSLVRNAREPVAKTRPSDFLPLAKADLLSAGIFSPSPHYFPETPAAERRQTLQWHQERYFYRTSEIRARADRVNKSIQPDLVLCLHFNADSWGDPDQPQLVEKNHLHLLINGGYSMEELVHHDERFEMLLKLLQGIADEERPLADAVSAKMAQATQLPAFDYQTNNVTRPSKNPYVYGRNLLANRLYECPVIYLEPYVMNQQGVFQRVQAGAYEGKQVINGRACLNLYEEYAQGVLNGLIAYYQAARQ